MQFAFETKKEGIISVTADIVDGELKVNAPLSEKLGKIEKQDILSVARTLLMMEGKIEDKNRDIRNYK